VESGIWNKLEFPLKLDLKNICSLINIKIKILYLHIFRSIILWTYGGCHANSASCWERTLYECSGKIL